MAVKPQAPRAPSFSEHLKQALEQIDNPELLGDQSPLAAPYFLGEALRGVDATPLARGQVLRSAIDRCMATMWGGPLPDDGREMLDTALDEETQGGRYDCLILELNYLHQRYRPAPRNQAAIYHDILHISRPTHDRHLRSAIANLASLLLQQLRPAVRPEQPVVPPTLIGRDQLHQEVLAALQAGKAVSLTGPGGVGKTSLGAALAEDWVSPAVFWFTFRPTFNDQLDSLLFALGHFLHEGGASALWHQLVADGGHIKDSALALGLTLGDLGSKRYRPLLCFDELDFLRPLTQDQAKPNHVQILEFLDSLRGHVPMVLIGQRSFWESDAIYRLDGLTEDEFRTWLSVLSVPHSRADVASLHAYTAGNPRLAELCIALYQTAEGESLASVLDQLPRFHALLPLWLRLERRLPAAERRVLEALSVFRSPAPADAWLNRSPEEAEALDQLIARRLVQQDDQSGVALLPALAEVVHVELPVEVQEDYHEQAAQIRAERGEYTAAAYHLVHAGHPEEAIQLWYPQRSHEINRGQAGAAQAIFSQISQRRLAPARRKELLLLRAELHELAGEPARVIEDLQPAGWSNDDPATPEAMQRLGQAFEAQGQPDAALTTYQIGLDTVAQLLRQSAQLHVQRGLTLQRQRDMQGAWREANLARFHAETMLGAVLSQRGDYETAISHYLTALETAEEANYPAGIAQTHHYLAIQAGRRGKIDEAETHFEQAIEFYERIGDRVNREYVRSNLASAYIQNGRFAESLEPAERALGFFQAMGNSFRTAQNASNLAEAHAELGNLEPAQHYAELVLEQEEPHSHPYALYTLGTVYKLRGDWERSFVSYDHSRKMAEANDDTYLLTFAWRALGEVYTHTARAGDAQAALAEALELFERLAIAEEVRRTREMM
ncbi:MAG: tetratricopeptide repeat protein [Caldilineales bacterium]